MIPDLIRYDEWYWESEGAGAWWFGPPNSWMGVSEYYDFEISYTAWRDKYHWDSGPIRE